MARLPYVIPYDPDFLGNGFQVPLPKTCCNGKLLNNGKPIDYIHFSLVMHKDRRMALYTAHNIDMSQKRSASRTGWDLDPRIDSANQVGNEAYRNNDWDRGHLVRRNAVAWGPGTEAQDASDSTFYYPVANLQKNTFNQSNSKWLGLEDWILQKAGTFATRLCVFTGPIYTTFDEEERGVKVPAAFFKIVVLLDPTSDGQDLVTLGFIMKQNINWRNSGPRALTNLEPYHVSIAEIETYTGLKFGAIADLDEFDWRQVRFKNRAKMPSIKVDGPEDIIFSGDKRRARGIRSIRTFTSGEAMRQNTPQKRNTPTSATTHDCGCQDKTIDLEAEVRSLKLQTTALCEIIENMLENGLANTSTRGRSSAAANTRALLARIIGGQMVAPGEFPDCVAVGDDTGYFCTGVLVHPRVVLTAGHCAIDGPVTKVFLKGRQLSNQSQGEVRAVENVIVHPNYTEREVPWNDITVLILSEPSTVQPVAIASMAEFQADDSLTLVGFGSDSPDGQSGFGTKRRVDVGLTNTTDYTPSQVIGVQREHGFDVSKEFHGGRVRSGMDTCNGDSGGPAYLNIADGSETGAFKVAGLTSRAANSSTVNCGDGGIYTLIPAYLPWLHEVTGGLIGTPAAEDTDTSDDTAIQTDFDDIFISSAMPNPEGTDDGNEWIEITNRSDAPVNLATVSLVDKQGGRLALLEIIDANTILRFIIPQGHPLKLGNSGDSIKLLAEDDTLIHEVGYDKAHSGEVITFDLPLVPDPEPEPEEPTDPEPAPPTDDCECECHCDCCGNHDICDGPIDPNFTPGALRC